jgi:hypothetical protein
MFRMPIVGSRTTLGATSRSGTRSAAVVLCGRVDPHVRTYVGRLIPAALPQCGIRIYIYIYKLESQERDRLFVQTPEGFRQRYNVDVRVNAAALECDPKGKRLLVRVRFWFVGWLRWIGTVLSACARLTDHRTSIHANIASH